MMKFLATLWSRRNRAQQPGRLVRRRARPTLEWLEDRSLPSATHVPLVDLVPPSAHAVAVARPADLQDIPFKISGGGIAAQGIPLALGVAAPHNATGTATHLGKYSAEGMFQLDSFTSATTGTFSSAAPCVFVAANGERLAFNYAGTFEVLDAGGGKVYAVFVATFTPDPEASTGRFTKYTGGSFVMTATTEPFMLGATDRVAYTWVGDGSIAFGKGNK